MKSVSAFILTGLGTCLIVLLSASSSVAQPIDTRSFTPVEIGNKWVYQHRHYVIPPGESLPLPGELRGYLVTEISRDTIIADEQYLIFDRHEYDADFNLVNSQFCLFSVSDSGHIAFNSSGGSFCHSSDVFKQYSFPSTCIASGGAINTSHNVAISISGIDYTIPYTHWCSEEAYHGGGWTFSYAWNIGLYHWLRRQPPRHSSSGYQIIYSLGHAIISGQEYGSFPLSNDDNEPLLKTEPIFAMYPNPAISSVTIDLGSNTAEAYSVTLFDIAGRTVYAEVFDTGLHEVTIPVMHLPSGTYIVRATDQEGNSSVRLLTRP